MVDLPFKIPTKLGLSHKSFNFPCDNVWIGTISAEILIIEYIPPVLDAVFPVSRLQAQYFLTAFCSIAVGNNAPNDRIGSSHSKGRVSATALG